MSNTEASAGNFKPASLGIIFLTFGMALIKMGDLSTLNGVTALTNTVFMWISFVLSFICLIMLVEYIVSRQIRSFMDLHVKKYVYHISVFYLFAFAVNWSLNLNNTGADILFQIIFWLGFLWFLVLLFILLSSLPAITKYITSGLFMGAGIQPLLTVDITVFAVIFVIGILVLVAALRNWNLSQYYPLY
jgi:hypothetical protein